MLSYQYLLVFFVLPLATVAAPSPSVSPVSACRSSFYPKLCRAVLSPLRFPSNQYEYGRYSVKKALKRARRTAALFDRYISGAAGGGRARRGVSGGALEDCRALASLNADYLKAVQAELGPREAALGAAAVGRVRALMSAVVTNQQTCYDGLEVSHTFPELRGALADETRLYGVSLGLVTTALDRSGNRGHGKSTETDERTGSTGGQRSPPADFSAIGRNLLEESGEVVPVNQSQSVTVAKDGSGNFTTVGDAVAFAPNNTAIEDGYFAIYIEEGVYSENVVVPKNKKNLILIGVGINRTIITSNRSVVDGWTTFASATFVVHGERFIAIDITFENTAGPEKHQAVAVRNSADLSSFYRCSFLGYQDTLYAHSLRQFYRDCDVYGTVDFIFGNAASVFQNCNIYARKPLPGQVNAVTAQGRTMPDQTTGISIHNCTVRAAPDLEAADRNFTKTFLGRPWKEYSRTVYMQSFIDGLIEPVGWLEWSGSFALTTLYYGEFDNHGPGANTSGRVQWPGYSLMNAMDALNFTVYNFTTADAWLSSTSIPYSGGLL
ncbi:pectinesterase-like [Musa acuminata AAA Group]|uniref:pectinesterase-like n=1 Tax=Musa acuminata AAA Group TaxID=214697 RepID=UPI0031E18983